MKNKVQLITYVDRLGGKSINDLQRVLTGPLAGLFGAVHILPFFDPIDGADAGFDPIDHTIVDPKIGEWNDIQKLSQHIDVMADLIVNHISSESPQFQDYSEKGVNSEYNGLFLTMDAVFPAGATEVDILKVYRPRPGLPFTYKVLKNGEAKILWTTFTDQQIDINIQHPAGDQYLKSILQTFARNGINVIRLDAVGYAIKKAGTSCFMIPETFDFIDQLTEYAHGLGIEVLVEIHSHYATQLKIAERVDFVYDFALPPLLLHAVCYKTTRYLKKWIEIRPDNNISVLDTHDGIGIIDIGPENEKRGLVPPGELDVLVEWIHNNSDNQSRKATGAAASNLDLYQVNCTYFDALGRNEKAYLLTRAVQFFLPGIPQVYYVGLLAGMNDMDLLKQTNVGRDINRHYYSYDEIVKDLEKPVVKELKALIQLRNSHEAFNGTFSVDLSQEHLLHLQWKNDSSLVSLHVDFAEMEYKIL